MNLGTLLVRMNAETKALAKGMRDGLREVQQTAQAMKRLGSEVGQVGVAMTGFFTGMVKAAAGVDNGVKASVMALKNSFTSLAVQVAHMVMPAMQQLGQLLREAASWFAGLPPSTRLAISDFALFAVKAGAIGLAVSKLMGLLSGLISLFSGLAGVVAAIGAGPLTLIVAGLVAVLTVVAVLHKAWRLNWGGIRDITKSVIETISGWWAKFASFFGDIWAGIVDDLASKAKAIVSLVLLILKETGKISEGEQRLFAQAAFTGISTLAGIAKSPKAMGNIALEAGKVLKEGGLALKDELVLIGKEIRDALGFKSSGGKPPGVADDDWYASMGYSKEGHDRIEKNVSRGRRMGGTDSASRASAQAREASAEFWKGMENLGPTGVGIATLAYQFKETLAAAFSGLGTALVNGGQMMLSKMGELGTVIQSAIQGAQSGGIWGAIIAVFVELLSRFERFQEIIDIGNGQLKQFVDMLSDCFDPIIDALRTFMGASGYVTEVVLKLLAPIFTQLGKAIESVVPLIMAIAEALALFQPIFDLIGQILGPIFEGIGYVMRFVGLTILGTMNGLLYLWIGILSLVREIAKAFGANTNDIDKLLVDAVVKLGDTQAKMKNLAETGMIEVAKAAADASEGLGKTADAARETAEQLLNVPEGYKVAMNRFAAIATSTGGRFGTMLTGDESRELFLKTGNPARSRFYGRSKG